MGVFTREEEELRVYDGDAFFYFAGAVLLTAILPWTIVLIRRLMWPAPDASEDWASRGSAPKDAIVRICATEGMQDRREGAVRASRVWRARLRSNRNGLQLGVLSGLWVLFLMVSYTIVNMPEQLNGFDPYAILGVETGAEMSLVKKAYRAKSLAHHPDKDRENPLAPALFQQISKAYAALTEEGARENYQKYGNPDGPVQSKVGIALHPAILGSKTRQLSFVVAFFALIVLVPLALVCGCLRGSNLSANGVDSATLKIITGVVDCEVTENETVGIFSATTEACEGLKKSSTNLSQEEHRALVSAMCVARPTPLVGGTLVELRSTKEEWNGRYGVFTKRTSRSSGSVDVFPRGRPPQGPEDITNKEFPIADMRPAEPRLECPFNDGHVRRTATIVWAHLWRLHSELPPAVREELDGVLSRTALVCRAMISHAANGKGDRAECFDAFRACVRFRQCVVQALDFEDSPLLQIPHVSAVPKPGGDKSPWPSLKDVVADTGGARAKLCELASLPAGKQRLDVDAFCRHVPQMQIETEVKVEDEDAMADGDLATLTVTLVRANLADGEAVGAAHAPFFPCPKFEEWWVVIMDDIAKRFISAQVVLGTKQRETCKVKFLMPRSGEFRWSVHAMCDAYAGLDVEKQVQFTALKKGQVDRSVFVHPEDVHIRSFFEDLMMGLQQPEEEESESEEEFAAKEEPKTTKPLEAPPAEASPEAEAPLAEAAPKAEASPETAKADEAAAPAEKEASRRPSGAASAAAAVGAKATQDSDSDDSDAEPEGVLFMVTSEENAPLYMEPFEGDIPAVKKTDSKDSKESKESDEEEDEDEQEPRDGQPVKVGSIPSGAIMRCQVEGRPEGWMELIMSKNSAFCKIDASVKRLGPFFEQKLGTVVQTQTPLTMLRRWMKKSEVPVSVEDFGHVRDIENERVRAFAEELLFLRVGADRFTELVNGIRMTAANKKQRLSKARGYFTTQNNCVWYVNPSGKVVGLHPDGSRIVDKIVISENGKSLSIGPFTLDESRTCSCIHWVRRDNPEMSWVWNPDESLETRVRLGTAF